MIPLSTDRRKFAHSGHPGPKVTYIYLPTHVPVRNSILNVSFYICFYGNRRLTELSEILSQKSFCGRFFYVKSFQTSPQKLHKLDRFKEYKNLFARNKSDLALIVSDSHSGNSVRWCCFFCRNTLEKSDTARLIMHWGRKLSGKRKGKTNKLKVCIYIYRPGGYIFENIWYTLRTFALFNAN
jgi:hypothetical protein